MSVSSAKHHRWIDLLATLLAHRQPLPFEQIARTVPAYLVDGSVAQGHPSAAVKRMFERDKKELREFGVPIETVGDDGSPDAAYRLVPDDFYLPYLAVVTPHGRSSPRIVDRYGYRALTRLAFEPDELAVVAEAARRTLILGDPAIRADVESAVRKLAFDLPLDSLLDAEHGEAREQIRGRTRNGASPRTEVHHHVPHRDPSDVLESLGDALVRRKQVTFTYLSMRTGTTGQRTVEPYGLFFLNAHWYLAAHDVDKDALRNFRVSRIRNVQINTARASTPDYTIPPTFHLRDHAQSRHAWELGDGDTITAIVEFTADTGAAVAGAQLGTPVPNLPRHRQFRVRRLDAFARWLLEFAGDARPLSPPPVVSAFRTLVMATCATYDATG